MTALENQPAAESWKSDAACAETDPDLFTDTTATRQAQKVCAGCDVVEACLGFAMRNNITAGVFGGKTAIGRRRLRTRASQL